MKKEGGGKLFHTCAACGSEFDTPLELGQHYDRCIVLTKRLLSAQDMAEDHWAYTERMMHQAYVEAFVHGWKHGRTETKS